MFVIKNGEEILKDKIYSSKSSAKGVITLFNREFKHLLGIEKYEGSFIYNEDNFGFDKETKLFLDEYNKWKDAIVVEI